MFGTGVLDVGTGAGGKSLVEPPVQLKEWNHADPGSPFDVLGSEAWIGNPTPFRQGAWESGSQ